MLPQEKLICRRGFDQRTGRCRVRKKKKSIERVSVPLFNSGQGQGLSIGDVDPHYTVAFNSDLGLVPNPAYVTYNETWSENDEESKWISYSVEAANTISFGVTLVKTQFDLTGFDPSTMILSLEIQVDDSLDDIYMNTDPFIGQPGIGLSIEQPGHDSWHQFTISSGFTNGINSLYFYFRNTLNLSTGIRVRMTGTAVRI